MPAMAVTVISVYLLSCGTGELIAVGTGAMVVVVDGTCAVIDRVVQGDDAGKGNGGVQDSLGNVQGRVDLDSLLCGVEPAAPHADEKNELHFRLSEVMPDGKEIAYKEITLGLDNFDGGKKN